MTEISTLGGTLVSTSGPCDLIIMLCFDSDGTIVVDIDTADLTACLAEAIANDDPDDARDLALLALHKGLPLDIDSSEDPEEEEFGEPAEYRGSRIASTQLHTMYLDGTEVSSIEREGWSYYGDVGHPNTPSGEWTTDVGEGDRGVPDAWAAVCSVFGESGAWEFVPCAGEPAAIEIETDDEGVYCLYWLTACDDDAGPLVDTRYPTLEDAMSACRQANHRLARRHRGTLLCGYAISELIDGEWHVLEETE